MLCPLRQGYSYIFLVYFIKRLIFYCNGINSMCHMLCLIGLEHYFQLHSHFHCADPHKGKVVINHWFLLNNSFYLS
jgi:hypothetical protein